MTIQGKKENCQMEYKGGAITAPWAVFNSIGAMPGGVPRLIIHSSVCIQQTSMVQILVTKNRPPHETFLSTYAIYSYTSKGLEQRKGRKNLKICTLPLYQPVFPGDTLSVHWNVVIWCCSVSALASTHKLYSKVLLRYTHEENKLIYINARFLVLMSS